MSCSIYCQLIKVLVFRILQKNTRGLIIRHHVGSTVKSLMKRAQEGTSVLHHNQNFSEFLLLKIQQQHSNPFKGFSLKDHSKLKQTMPTFNVLLFESLIAIQLSIHCPKTMIFSFYIKLPFNQFRGIRTLVQSTKYFAL